MEKRPHYVLWVIFSMLTFSGCKVYNLRIIALEPRQYKDTNFYHHQGEGKVRQFQDWNYYFFTQAMEAFLFCLCSSATGRFSTMQSR